MGIARCGFESSGTKSTKHNEKIRDAMLYISRFDNLLLGMSRSDDVEF